MSRPLIEQCEGRWRDVLIAVGIPATALTGKPTACPSCGGKDRFRFDDKNGSGSWFCNQCPRRSGYGIHLPQQVFGWSYAETCDAIEAVLVGADPEVKRAPVAALASASPADASSKALAVGKTIWQAAQRINEENATGRYLAARGLPDVADALWLRHGDKVTYLDDDGVFCGFLPAMLAVVKAPAGNITGLHRTFLRPDGAKADVPAPRKLLGTLPDGAAVRLAAHVDTLGIAEGIETALSATTLFGVPCWAAINANGLAKWSPPEGVTEVVIFGDNDVSFTGQEAAYALAKRLARLRLGLSVKIPSSVGDDWNDVLRKGGQA